MNWILAHAGDFCAGADPAPFGTVCNTRQDDCESANSPAFQDSFAPTDLPYGFDSVGTERCPYITCTLAINLAPQANMHPVKEIHYNSQSSDAQMNCFAFLPEGRMIAGDSEGNLQLFGSEGGALALIPSHEGPVRVVAVAHGYIFSAGEDRSIVVRQVDAPSDVIAKVVSDAVVAGIFVLEESVLCWDEAGGLTYLRGDKVLSKKETDIPAAQTWGRLCAASDSTHVVIWDANRILIAEGNPEVPLQTHHLREAISSNKKAHDKMREIESCHLGREGLVAACDQLVYTCAWNQALHLTEIDFVSTKADLDSYIRTLVVTTPGFTSVMATVCLDAITSATRERLSQTISSNGCHRNIPAPWGFGTFRLIMPSAIEVLDESEKKVFYGGLSQWDASLDGFFPLPVRGAGLVWGWKTIRAVSQAVTTGEWEEATPFWEHEMADYGDPTAVLVEGDRILVCGEERALELGLADLCEAAVRHEEYVETVDTSCPLFAWRMEDPTRCLVPLHTGSLLLVSAGKVEELPFKCVYWKGGICVLGNVILIWQSKQLFLLDIENAETAQTLLSLKIPKAASKRKLDSEHLRWAGVFANESGNGFIAIQKSGAIYSVSKSGKVAFESQLPDPASGARGTPEGMFVQLSSGGYWKVARDGRTVEKAQNLPPECDPPEDDSDSLSLAEWGLWVSEDDDPPYGVALFRGDEIAWSTETRNAALPLALLASGHAVVQEGKSMKIIELGIPPEGFEFPRQPDPNRSSASFNLLFGAFEQIDGIA